MRYEHDFEFHASGNFNHLIIGNILICRNYHFAYVRVVVLYTWLVPVITDVGYKLQIMITVFLLHDRNILINLENTLT